MTDQERQLIEELGGRMQRAPAAQVDKDADELIRRTIGSRPDALYILTQTVLLQEMALNQSKQQIDELKRQQQSSQPPQSFLGNTAPQPSSQPAGGYRASSYQTGYQAPPPPPAQPQYAQPQYAPVEYVQAQPEGRFSGFLRGAAQTAAGVVAGEVAFSALSSLFGHHHDYYGGGGGGFFEGGNVISPVPETIINNNYYEDNRVTEHEQHRASEDSTGYTDNSADTADTSYDSATDDASVDDTSVDDNTLDDSGFDDDSGSTDV